jgi:MYXO-CTERM domain-containing protein
MRHQILAASLLCTALAASGCGRHLEFQDNFSGLLEERVQRPYAVGTTATVTVQWSTLDPVDGWMAHSENPAVVQVLSQAIRPGGPSLEINVQALAEGNTQLVVTNGQEVMGTASMRVVRATQLQLLDHALQKTTKVSQDVGDEVRVVAGQPAAVEARYLDASQEHAWGRDLVTWPEVEGLKVWTDAETLGRDAEYVLVQPTGLEAYDLPLSLNGEAKRTLRVIGVPEADIIRVDLLPPPEHNAEEGDSVCGGLLAYDAAGNRVYGAPADWTLTGGVSVGSGDLLCYTYAPSQPATSVTVQVGATGGQLLVRGKNFYVSSTATIGCSVGGPAASSTAGGILAILALVLFVLRLRRLSR